MKLTDNSDLGPPAPASFVIDAEQGDDENDGSRWFAVKTWSRLNELIGSGPYLDLTVFIVGDIDKIRDLDCKVFGTLKIVGVARTLTAVGRIEFDAKGRDVVFDSLKIKR